MGILNHILKRTKLIFHPQQPTPIVGADPQSMYVRAYNAVGSPRGRSVLSTLLIGDSSVSIQKDSLSPDTYLRNKPLQGHISGITYDTNTYNVTTNTSYLTLNYIIYEFQNKYDKGQCKRGVIVSSYNYNYSISSTLSLSSNRMYNLTLYSDDHVFYAYANFYSPDGNNINII